MVGTEIARVYGSMECSCGGCGSGRGGDVGFCVVAIVLCCGVEWVLLVAAEDRWMGVVAL